MKYSAVALPLKYTYLGVALMLCGAYLWPTCWLMHISVPTQHTPTSLVSAPRYSTSLCPKIIKTDIKSHNA